MLFEESVVSENLTVEHGIGKAVHPEVGAHVLQGRDPAVFPLAVCALLSQLAEVDLGRLISDRDVDLALGEYEVRDLVVATAWQPLRLQKISRVDVMNVASIQE